MSASQYIETISCLSAVVVSVGAEPPAHLTLPSVPFINAAFADGTDGDLRWAGGSAPTLTTTADKADIVSILWDADDEIAYGVASLDFRF